jgi:hypothetical protein
VGRSWSLERTMPTDLVQNMHSDSLQLLENAESLWLAYQMFLNFMVVHHA